MAVPFKFCFQRMIYSLKSIPVKIKKTYSLSNMQIKLRFLSSGNNFYKTYNEKDPAPVFFNADVQGILKKLTGCDLEKVFKGRHLSKPEERDEYKFLTKEDLEEYMERSYNEANQLLQMPPVIKVREPISQVLSYDPALEGAVTSKIIFTDVSFGIGDRKRVIVVRETDGTLRAANWEERDRMNQVYNPRIGRFQTVPAIFEEKNLKSALEREEYCFVLDFACSQFEPDNELFHKITSIVYEYVNQRGKFESLHSTRHYGPFCFYLAWNRNIDNLLIKYIHDERLLEGADLVKLFYLIQTDCKSTMQEINEENSLDIIKKYVAEDANLKPSLHLALQSYQDLLEERKRNQMQSESSQSIS